MPSTAGDPSSNATMSTWEQAYSDAWHRFRQSIVEVINRLQRENPSTDYRLTTIQQLDQLTIHVDRIQSDGQAMFEHDTGCHTVRQHPLTYFGHEFISDCLHLHVRLNLLTWRMMNFPQSDQAVCNRLLRLLEHIESRIPNQ